MSPEDNSPLDAIPLEPGRAAGPAGAPGRMEEEDLFKPAPSARGAAEPPSRIHTFESDSTLGKHGTEYHRPLKSGGIGATRVRTFHAKLADTAMSYLEGQINDWLDKNPDVEVKFSNTTVGVVEGKRSEPHLIITVWY